MIVIESTGRKLKDAIDNGLAKLNKTLMDVEVEVLDNGGLFRKAKVRITAKGDEENVETPVAKVEQIRNEQVGNNEQVKIESAKPEHKREQRRSEPKKAVKSEQQKSEPKRNQSAQKAANVERKKSEECAVKSEEEHNEENKELRRNVSATEEVAAQAQQLVKQIVEKMGFETSVMASIVSGGVVINLESQASELIGYHGEVLDAIEYIVSCAINKEDDKYYRVVVDCDNYRAKRKESLVALANKMAAKCLKVRHKVILEPMNSNERRIIHATLASNDKIITRSEGHEPNRRVVIFCKRR